MAKEEVMEGYPKCPNLIAASVYNTKTFHYISTVSEQFEWVMKQKEFVNVKTGKVEN